MNKNEITLKVRQRLDEVGVNEIVSLNFPITPFIDEAANQVMFDVPLCMTANIVDFSDSKLVSNSDGSGTVELPESFVKLVEFKMNSWKCSVDRVVNYTKSLLQKQNNRITAANPMKPIVAINGGKLHYFGADATQNSVVDTAKAQVYMKKIADYPAHLSDPIAWLAASKVLQVMNESVSANSALKQYTILLENLIHTK